MTFSNRYVNRQSSGGKRRGLIWLNDTISIAPDDERFLVFTPYRGPGYIQYIYPGAETIQLTEGYNVAPSACAVTGFKIPFTGETSFQMTLYPYTTTTDTDTQGNTFITTYADEKTFTVDVDFYIDPMMVKAGDNNLDPEIIVDSFGEYQTLTNFYQLTNGIIGKAIGYFCDSPGEIYQPDPGNNPIYDRLKMRRISYPSAPCRIKMRIVYSDYPFALSGKFTGGQTQARAIELPFETWTQHLTNILDTYIIPADSDFSGASIQSKLHGNLYNDFHIEDSVVQGGSRIEKYSSATANHKWFRYTEGALYNSNIGGYDTTNFQTYLTPLLYPAVYQLGNYSDDDYTINLPSEASQLDMNDFSEHASPYLLPPVIRTPMVEYIDYSYGTITPNYYRTALAFAPGNYSSSSIYNNLPFLISGIPTGNIIRNSMLGAHGISVTSAQEIVNNIQFTNPLGHTGNARDSLKGYLQPKVTRGEKYTQEFKTVVSKGDSRYNTAGAFSGRFKYVGIKGKISWFEAT